MSHVPIHESGYVPLHGATVAGRPDRDAPIQVTVVVRRRSPAPDLHVDEAFAARLPHHRSHASSEAFAAAHGAHPDDLDRVERFARTCGLNVRQSLPAQRSAVLAGPCGAFAEAFAVEMVHYDHPRGRHRGITGLIHAPEELADVIEAVFGLDDRPCAWRHLATPGAAEVFAPPFRAKDLAELYRFPQHANGAGQCIGVIELGGGYHRSDLERFFSLSEIPPPDIIDVSVDDAVDSPAERAAVAALMAFAKGEGSHVALPPADLESAVCTIETTMDIELAAAFAPGARIVVYFAPNNEQGIFRALATALADQQHRPSVLSLSWGEPEPSLSAMYARTINDVLREAASLGVTVCVSSGDYGAPNRSPDYKPSVNFPASSPYALGCGGTTLEISGKAIAQETVWNSVINRRWGASGGGVSRLYERPPWQRDFAVPHPPTEQGGRGVPDVAGPADPRTGCRIVVGGVEGVSAGTSAVAPIWAALAARLNHALGARAGYLNSLLYRLARQEQGLFRAVTQGDNRGYAAGPGWNACTGLGSPVGDRLLAALEGRG
jgi:kumamolisin